MTTTADVAFDQATLERFADLAVGFARQRPARPDRRHRRRARQGGDDPRARGRAPTGTARSSSTSSTSTCTSSARGSCTPTRTRSTSCRRGTASGSSSSASQRCARIGLVGPGRRPGCSTTSTRRRAGRDQLPVRQARPASVVNDAHDELDDRARARRRPGRSWCIPDLDRRRGARDASCEQIVHVCRLDEDDPVAAWRERAGPPRRRRRAAHRAALRRAALRGPGHRPAPSGCCRPRRSWRRASRPSTASSTCPTSRPRRSSARPTRSAPTASCARRSRSSSAGSIVRGLEVEFRDGPRGAHRRRRGRRRPARLRRARRGRRRAWARSRSSTATGRIGPLDTVFFDTLLDENAATPHRARPAPTRSPRARRTSARLNHSRDPRRLHDRRRRRRRSPASPRTASDVPVLRGGAWQL